MCIIYLFIWSMVVFVNGEIILPSFSFFSARIFNMWQML